MSARRLKWPLIVAAMAAGSALAGPIFASARASTTCSYVSAGPAGPRGNRLDVVGDFVTLTRKGSRVRVLDFGRPVRCTGGTPTVVNIDRITVLPEQADVSLDLEVDLGSGALGPGATPERRGSEIEILADRVHTLHISGGDGRDMITVGNAVGGGVAANLDVAADGRSPDSDLTATPDPVEMAVYGNGGPDRLSAQGGRGFASKLTIDNRLSFHGDRGNDLLLGSPRQDLLIGGAGNDFSRGGDGRDHITTGQGVDTAYGGPLNDYIEASGVSSATGFDEDRKGPDRVYGGKGDDFVQAIDKAVDIVNCGPGKDGVNSDKRDRLVHCSP